MADATPSGDNAFKIELARRIVVRALSLAAAGTPERMPALPASPFSGAVPMPEISLTQAPAHIRMGSNIGQPLTRREGVLKTTGSARYAADNHPPGMVYAVLAVSRIARGRVAALDVAAAKAHPGVIEVMTPANAPKLAMDPDAKLHPFMFRMDLLQNDTVRYANQPIAVVVAETLEAATEGAVLLAPRYETEPPRTGLDSADSFAPEAVGAGSPAEEYHGDVEAGLAAASVRVEAVYETPAQYHNAMEPHAIVAAWDGDTLTIDTPSQGMAMAQDRIAGLLGIAPDEHPHPQPVSRRRLRLEGAGQGAADPRHHGRPAGRPPGEAGTAARADVRPRRPPRPHPADTAPGRRRAGQADGAQSPCQDRHQHVRRFHRAGGQCLPRAVCQSGDQDVARGGADRYRDADVHARARRGPRQCRAGERDRRDGTGLRHGPTRVPAEELRRGRADERQAVLLQGAAPVLSSRAPNGSAGPAARWRRGRCGTKPACWSAGAWEPRCFRR